MAHHRLALSKRDRTWLPTCACAVWFGVPSTRKGAEVQYREHVNQVIRQARRSAPARRALTPPDKLPEALRQFRGDDLADSG